MKEKSVLLLQMGDTPDFIRERCGNFDEMFAAAVPDASVFHVVHVEKSGCAGFGSPGDHQSVVVTGSHAMVTDCAPWSEECAAWLRRAVEEGTPVFGVCYGHQLLAHALGGTVGYHPDGMELGTFEVSLTAKGQRDPFLCDTPAVFPANLSHSQSVLALPPGAVVLAGSAHDPHQIIRYGKNAVSVQFHPEFGATEMRTYEDYQRSRDPDFRFAGLADHDTPRARALLRRFVGAGC